MEKELVNYVKKARKKGLDTPQIIELLQLMGWTPAQAIAATLGDDLVPPAPPTTMPPKPAVMPEQGSRSTSETEIAAYSQASTPVEVVQTLTTKGIEYLIMFIALWGAAFSLGLLLHQLVDTYLSTNENNIYNGGATFGATTLIVCLPIFLCLFLYLKKAELLDTSIKKDPSRRKLVQLTLLVSFLFGIGYIISFLYTLIQGPDPYSGTAPSLVRQLLHMLITILIAGGIFTYYWVDEHRQDHA